jgi:hypothetical protein
VDDDHSCSITQLTFFLKTQITILQFQHPKEKEKREKWHDEGIIGSQFPF